MEMTLVPVHSSVLECSRTEKALDAKQQAWFLLLHEERGKMTEFNLSEKLTIIPVTVVNMHHLS